MAPPSSSVTSSKSRNMTMSSDQTVRRPPGRFIRERRDSEREAQSTDPRGSLWQSLDNVGDGIPESPRSDDGFYDSEKRRR